MHFIDLKYKGVRIRRGWSHLLIKIFMGLFLVPALACFLKVLFVDWNYSILKFPPDHSLSQLGKLFLFSLLAGLITMVIAIGALIPLWDYIANLQRLCRMIYSAEFYLVNKIESPNMMKNENTKVKKEIVYFPSFYYRINRRKGFIEVTVRLDGSKFHKSGDYLKLTDMLQEIYALNVVDVSERNGFYTYYLMKNVEKYRLHINDIVPEKCQIPLMKHITWDIVERPHALICGGTGGGKTYFLNIMLRSFGYIGADIRLCDPKHSLLADYRRVMPYVVSEVESILKIVERTVVDMKNRYTDIKMNENYLPGQNFTHYGMKPIILMIDEYVSFVDALDKKGRETFKSNMNQIVLQGREAGVFVVLATQRPDAEYLGGGVRDQLGLRITLGKMSEDGFRMVFGKTEQKLKNKGIKGGGYIYMDGYTFIQPFHAPLVPDQYDFIGEFAKLLGVELCACGAQREQESTDSKDQHVPSGTFIPRETIYEEVKS